MAQSYPGDRRYCEWVTFGMRPWPNGDVELSHQLADRADRISKRYFSADGVEARSKPDGSPVTEADYEIERELREVLAQARPGDAFAGEEFGSFGQAGRRWLIDPIDGTAIFSAGRPWWSTLIGAEDHGEVTAGLISAPALGRRWWGSAGGGAWVGERSAEGFGEPVALGVSTTDSLSKARIRMWPLMARATAGNRSKALRLVERFPDCQLVDDWGAVCHGGLLVADGTIDAFVHVAAGPWDIAAAVPIVEEAGGRFSDLAGGRDIYSRAALYSNGRVHDEALEALGAPTP